MRTYVIRSILAGLAVMFSSSMLAAQAFDFALFGGAGGGVAAYDNGAFSRRLKSYTPVHGNGEFLLYQTEDFPTTGWTADASIGMLLYGEFMVGVSGQQVFYPVVKSINGPGGPRDEYRLTGSGGGLDLGYAIMNDGGTLIFPYVQGGYYGYALDYTNNQPVPVPFFEGEPVASGAAATYSGWAPRVALGIGFVRALGGTQNGSGGGLTLAARLSWGQMPSRPQWKEPDGSMVNNGGLTPAYNGVSLSVTIGGGIWSF